MCEDDLDRAKSRIIIAGAMENRHHGVEDSGFLRELRESDDVLGGLRGMSTSVGFLALSAERHQLK